MRFLVSCQHSFHHYRTDLRVDDWTKWVNLLSESPVDKVRQINKWQSLHTAWWQLPRTVHKIEGGGYLLAGHDPKQTPCKYMLFIHNLCASVYTFIAPATVTLYLHWCTLLHQVNLSREALQNAQITRRGGGKPISLLRPSGEKIKRTRNRSFALVWD